MSTDGDPRNGLVRRHRAFWDRDPVEEPILRLRAHRPLAWGGHHGRNIRPFGEGELIDPARMILRTEKPTSAMDEALFSGLALPGVCWTEALIGCPVRMETGGAWAESFLSSPEDIARLCEGGWAASRDPWFEKFREETCCLVKEAGDRFAVVPPLMRGPLDMMASALGHQAMVETFLDCPELAERLLALCSERFIELAREHHSIAGTFLGGSVIFGLWAPGLAIRTQLDNAVLLSPELYQRHALRYDSRIFESFDTVVIHVHSGCLHIVDELLEAPALNAIQVSIDHPGGPLAADILPLLARIQARKPLIVTGPVNALELEHLRALPPAGVALDLQLLDSPTDGSA